ncbi:MAG TPA: FAD-dependent oxidoreductase [Burkholderiaceae bacterium]|nr:FAD-dependent oxidoreductase [Burkholderiaceae bacterium]
MSRFDHGVLPADCDLLVVGSGCGALSAAVSAAHLGLDVVVVEKEPTFGGTTAWSAGWMFIPRNPLARAAGIDEDVAEPRRYLKSLCGSQFHAVRVEAFLAHGPATVQFHLDHTALRFIDGNAIPDFHGRAPGARTGGRSVAPAPFDGRLLGAHLARVRPPRDILSFLGMSIGGDVRHFLRSARAWDSFVYVARRVVRQLWDLAVHGQGRLRMGGNALVAALLKSALDNKVGLFESHAATGLVCDGARVAGARVRLPSGEERVVHARRGVVLAGGGFPHDSARKAELFAHAPTGREHWSAAPSSNTGDGLRMGEAVGGCVDRSVSDPGAWAPVSLVPAAGGGVQAFPHLLERGKPGLIAVDRAGRRFVDEAGDYHSFMRALFERCTAEHPGRPVEAWLVCDHRFQRRYGLGHAKPRPLPIRGALRSGYLKRAGTLEALAAACGIDATGLVRTVAEFNRHARAGRDPAYGRGDTPYDRMQGDPEHAGPNPCVAPLEHGPYYAVRVVPGSLGTFAGLAVNAHAQVLDAGDRPIEGLYAAGNDMASVMGGHYPSGGITLGPALVFGHVLAHHAAGRPLAMPPDPDPPRRAA